MVFMGKQLASEEIRGKTVAIIGGGPAGCANAIRLVPLSRKQDLGLRVVLFGGGGSERPPPRRALRRWGHPHPPDPARPHTGPRRGPRRGGGRERRRTGCSGARSPSP